MTEGGSKFPEEPANESEKLVPPKITDADLTYLLVKIDTLATAEDIHMNMKTRVAGMKAILHLTAVRGWDENYIRKFKDAYAEVKSWIVARETKKYLGLK